MAYKTKQNLHIDNSSSIWFLEDSPSYVAYIKFQEEFGSDEIYVGMVTVDNALDEKYSVININSLDLLAESKAKDDLKFVES